MFENILPSPQQQGTRLRSRAGGLRAPSLLLTDGGLPTEHIESIPQRLRKPAPPGCGAIAEPAWIDPRFFLLGLHHHPDSGRLHRFSAGRQQVKHRARRGLGEVGLIPSEGQRRPRAGATAPRGWGTPGRGLLVPWNPLAGLEHCASFQNKAPQRIWVFHGGRTLSPPPPCPGVTCFSRNGRRASVAARG